MASGLGSTSLATSGTGIVVLFNPAIYISFLLLLNISGEKSSTSDAKTAWHVSPSFPVRRWRRMEWPARAVTRTEMGDLGKRVLKRFGVQTPAVRIIVVQGTSLS
jgi:hypothetical protein